MNVVPRRELRQVDSDGVQVSSAEGELRYQQEAASYIAALLAELRKLAGMAELPRLTKAIDAAYYEAYAAADRRGRSNADQHNADQHPESSRAEA